MKKLLDDQTVRTGYARKLIAECFQLFQIVAPQDSNPARILCMILSGEHVTDVARWYEISEYQVNKACKEALNALKNVPRYEEVLSENERLKDEHRSNCNKYNMLYDKYNALVSMYHELAARQDQCALNTITK